MPGYILSPQAQISLQQISQYTFKQHGAAQRNTYLKMLRYHIRRIADNPSHGRERNAIKAGYYSLVAGKHNIYYRLRDTHVEILDVLHQSMEPQLHL
ncbi:MAG: type II toxin-antitoxin system RelE/ParE family toxin [Halioglobus sp.]|nr:type II toxin-antitoxin system RelE/ParE family toxin [Halioglobus sp.]